MVNPIKYSDREVIFTFLKIQKSMKVTAVDTQTGVEVIMQLPLSLSVDFMKAAVMQKLNYVMSKKSPSRSTF